MTTRAGALIAVLVAVTTLAACGGEAAEPSASAASEEASASTSASASPAEQLPTAEVCAQLRAAYQETGGWKYVPTTEQASLLLDEVEQLQGRVDETMAEQLGYVQPLLEQLAVAEEGPGDETMDAADGLRGRMFGLDRVSCEATGTYAFRD